MPFVILNHNKPKVSSPLTGHADPVLSTLSSTAQQSAAIPESRFMRPQMVFSQPSTNKSGLFLRDERNDVEENDEESSYQIPKRRRGNFSTITRPTPDQFYTPRPFVLPAQSSLSSTRTKEQPHRLHDVDRVSDKNKGRPIALAAPTLPNHPAEEGRSGYVHDSTPSSHTREDFDRRSPVRVYSDEEVARALQFYEVFGKGAQGFDPRPFNEDAVRMRSGESHARVVTGENLAPSRPPRLSPPIPQREQTPPEPLVPNTPSALEPRFRARDPVIVKRTSSEHWGVECCLHFEFTSPSGCRVSVENATAFIIPPEGYKLDDIEESPYGDFDMVLRDANGELTRMFADDM